MRWSEVPRSDLIGGVTNNSNEGGNNGGGGVSNSATTTPQIKNHSGKHIIIDLQVSPSLIFLL